MTKKMIFFSKFVDIMKNIVYTKSVLLYFYNGGLYNDIFEIDFWQNLKLWFVWSKIFLWNGVKGWFTLYKLHSFL